MLILLGGSQSQEMLGLGLDEIDFFGLQSRTLQAGDLEG